MHKHIHAHSHAHLRKKHMRTHAHHAGHARAADSGRAAHRVRQEHLLPTASCTAARCVCVCMMYLSFQNMPGGRAGCALF